jgi:uncharacterized membrane protein YccC
MAFMFVPILAPANEIRYDTLEFYNAALAIVAGCAVAALAFSLLPPLPPALRARRLLDFTLRDLRRSAIASHPPTLTEWEQRMYGRLAAMPDKAEPLQRSQLMAALTIGTEMLQLRWAAVLLPLAPELDAALSALAEADGSLALAEFVRLDRHLARLPGTKSEIRHALRARARILVIAEAIAQHPAFFDAGAPA